MSPMGQYLSPGVYMEEVDKGSKPIEAVGTALAGFVGFAASGPVGCPTLVTSWTQYTETFGGFLPDAYLAHSVYGYFNNGGSRAYITRLPGRDQTDMTTDGRGRAPQLTMPLLTLAGASGAVAEAVRLQPKDEGQTGENITVEVGPASGDPVPGDQVKITVRRGETKEEFDNLTIGARGPRARNLDRVIQSESKLITAELLKPDVDRRRPAAAPRRLCADQRPQQPGVGGDEGRRPGRGFAHRHEGRGRRSHRRQRP